MKHDKLAIRQPCVVCVDYHCTGNVTGVIFPDEIWLDGRIVPGCPVAVDIGWRFEIPSHDPVEWTGKPAR